MTRGLPSHPRTVLVITLVAAATGRVAAQVVNDNKLWLSGTGAADVTDSVRFEGTLELRSDAESGFD